MKTSRTTYFFHATIAFLNFVSNFMGNFLISPKKLKYAAPASFCAMHFESTKDQADEYLSVAQLSQRYPAFTQGSIRWLIFNGDSNGFKKVVRKIGRKVVLNLNEFKKFIENQAPR